MSRERENIDVDLYEDREDAIQAALDTSETGDKIIICRGDWATCPEGEICPMCARVVVTEGMTARDALDAAKAAHA